MKTCPKCGKRFPDEYGFCFECGSRLEKERTPAGKTGPSPRRVTKRRAEEVRTPAIKNALQDLEDAKKVLKAGVYKDAVVAVDRAVETVFRGWLKQSGTPRDKQPEKWADLIKALEKRGYQIPHKDDIWRVRKLRNRIAHEGYSAGQRDAETAIGVVEKFIDGAREIEAKKAEEGRRWDLRVPEAGRAERGEKKMGVRVPSPAPHAGRPKGREVPDAGRGPAGHRAGLRMAWEGVLAAAGLILLISSFIVSYGLIGKAPEPSNVTGVAILIAIGAIPTLFCRRGCSDVVRIGGGSAFAAAGLGLLLFSFLATHGLMWETLQLSNAVWLGVMIAVGALLAAAGIPMIHGLGDNARKAWGSAFAAAGLGALVICVIVAYDLMGRALQWANLVWLGIMMAVGAFAAWEGFPLVLEPKDRIRMAWEGAFMAAGIGTLVSCVVPARGLLNKTLETADAVAWLSVLMVIGTFLLAKGIGRVRER